MADNNSTGIWWQTIMVQGFDGRQKGYRDLVADNNGTGILWQAINVQGFGGRQ